MVVASATIALQEQLLFRDLPDVMRNSGLEYEAALAKGRGRYICLLKLDHQLSEQVVDPVIPLYPDEFAAPDRALAGPIFDEMVAALGSGRWDGDFDSWPGSLDVGVKRLVSTEQSQCIGRRCPHVSQCSFFRAREGLENADIVVTNHDLVLSDLRLGGGVILPAPEDSFYIFDEGHQLPSKCLNHFALRFHSGATLQGLRDSGRWVESSSADWIKRGLDERIMPTLAALFDDLLERTLQISETVWLLFPDEGGERAEYRLPHGRVPAEFAEQAAMLLAQWEKLYREAGRLEAMLENRTNETALVPDGQDEPASDPDLDLINAQGMVARAEQQVAVWKAFAQAPSTDQPGDGWARWCLHRGNMQSIECQASPILPGELLKRSLWDRVAGAVVTSATLSALGTFDRFRERSGIPSSARWKQVASPFDPKKAIFSVPVMTTEPSQADAHTEELIALIPELIRDDLGVLLLFTSRRQLEAVLAGIATEISHHRLVQDQLSKSALLTAHRRNVDNGEPSAIFGLASFFEGIDLPGDYCRHVVIAKLPFAVPDDPISSAHAELLDAQGRDPFMEINVPDAAQKLIQASGRLQRTEDDEGRITLLDKRLLSRRYGRVMLETLPAFTFELAGRASR